MFTANEKSHLEAALEMAIASNKRAKNTSKNPQFAPIYTTVDAELTALLSKIKLIEPPKK